MGRGVPGRETGQCLAGHNNRGRPASAWLGTTKLARLKAAEQETRDTYPCEGLTAKPSQGRASGRTFARAGTTAEPSQGRGEREEGFRDFGSLGLVVEISTLDKWGWWR